MDAFTLERRGIWPRIDSPAALRLARGMALTWLTALVACALLVAIRRWEGALLVPFAPGLLASAGAALALATAAARRALLAGGIASRAQRQAMTFGPSAVLLLAGGALSVGGSEPLGLAALWTAAALEEVLSLRPLFLPGTPTRVASPAVRPHSGQRQRALVDLPPGQPQDEPLPDADSLRLSSAAECAAEPAALEMTTGAEPLEPEMSQQFVRRQNAAGGETIEGLLRVRVARGQRHATAHVAICPPLERVGECYAEPCDGPPASVKVAQVLCYGVRFEIKLDEPPDEPASVVVEFAIHAPAEAA